jgi:hypothetical protein
MKSNTRKTDCVETTKKKQNIFQNDEIKSSHYIILIIYDRNKHTVVST